MSKDNAVSIRLDISAAAIDQRGVTEAQLDDLRVPLDAARTRVMVEDLDRYRSGSIPADMQPLDAGFIELPQRTLALYEADQRTSELGRILRLAEAWRQQVDRAVVVLGIGGSYMGAER